MIYVGVFNVAQYKSSLNRTVKPFNPLLGETYELDLPTFHYFSEQVSHHPPISATHATGKNGDYEYWMNSFMKA